jgi:hypothetical protein
MTDTEIQSAKLAIVRLVDSSVWTYVILLVEDRLAKDMLAAGTTAEREDMAAEYRLMERFLSSLTDIANQVRG